MAKRLVVCCDGTWNTPDQKTDGKPTPTNVAKVALGLAPMSIDGLEQRLYYHRGIGTRTDRLLGGAFGAGLFRDVCDTYRYVVENYQPGDELFFFGFSRGAFTARSTAGLIRNSGVLRRENADRIDEAYALYRDRKRDTHPRSVEATLFRKMYSHEPPIRFMGVWDTVGALGIPASGWWLANRFNRRYEFHDTELSSTVDEAYQALAIDEQRGPFVPAVWSQSDPVRREQRLEQVWFTGVHCDVGGGYVDHRLSDITLCWMLDKARGAGLAFLKDSFRTGDFGGGQPVTTEQIIDAYTRVRPDPSGAPHDSRTGIYRFLRPFIRTGGTGGRSNEYIASTVDARRRSPGWWHGPVPDGGAEHLIMPVEVGNDLPRLSQVG